MITQDLARMIYNCHYEINKTEEFIKTVKEDQKEKPNGDLPEYLRDRDNKHGYYTLGRTIGSSSSSLASVSPHLTIFCAEEHLKRLRETLLELKQQALKELEQ